MRTHGLHLTRSLYDEIEEAMCVLRKSYAEKILSEYTFSNLYFFRQAHHYRYFPGSLAHITGMTYDGTHHVLPLVDLRQLSQEDIAKLLDGHDCLFPIPEDALACLDSDRFCWTDSPDDADYFYSAENFRTYRGDLLRKKRNLMQQLLSSYQIEVKPLVDQTAADAVLILDAWMGDKQKLSGEADDNACREAIWLHKHFRMDGLVYYINGLPAGFLIAQPVAPSVAVMRFAKGCDSYKGIYQYMFHHYCSSRSHLHWINFEQDLGFANFRQTKRSYQPSAMLRKFRVRLRAR